MKYFVNDTWIEYNTSQEKSLGNNTVLLEKSVDLTKNTHWHQNGFSIEPLFSEEQFRQFEKAIYELLLDCWKKSGLAIPRAFKPEQYHAIANDQQKHLAAVECTKLVQIEDFPGGIQAMEERISEICKEKLVAKNPFDNQRVFHFRVVRPLSRDNNPLHRDVWLEDYDNCINLYIPVAGSNERSSLILFPGSHLWSESRVERTVSGAEINDIKFNVPAVTNIQGDYTIERPDPLRNEVLVFSPYLIHGGAVNLNTDSTRISIELRLWKK
jgi:hypothetical protein